MNDDWTTATACFVLGGMVTAYYYRTIRRRNYKMSPVAIKGVEWFHTPNKLRVPMWVAGGFSAAALLELACLLSLGFKPSHAELFRHPFFSLILGVLLSLIETNPLHLRDSQRKYPSFFTSLILGAALALLVCAYL